MIAIDQLIADARERKCSDIHLSLGLPPVFRIAGQLVYTDYEVTDDDIKRLIFSIMDSDKMNRLADGYDVDFCYQTPNGMRQRVNVYHEAGKLCCAIRLLNDTIPEIEELGLPPILKNLAMLPRGLVLVTGPTGSGKSTTLAAMIDYVNQHRRTHIITIEDPIEYKYNHKLALIHQREIGEDVSSFATALRSSLREDPDVILVGEMRDFETISAAITAAETGHLVFSTLHTTGAANTIDRIVDVFPPHSQGQVRSQLSNILRAVITQTLIPTVSGDGRVPALEILLGTSAVGNLIRDNKTHQIGSAMQLGMKDGMLPFNASLASLVNRQKISYEVAASLSDNIEELNQYLRQHI